MSGYNTEDYKNQQKKLLPQGRLYNLEDSSNLVKLLLSRAYQLEALDQKSCALPDEAIPLTTDELLADWERVLGLPEICTQGEEQTVVQRRNAVVSKLSTIGNLTKQQIIDLCEAAGYTITIEEFWDFQAGVSVAGDALTNGDWRFAFDVNVDEDSKTPFVAGSKAGEKLAEYGDTTVRCIVTKYKPAHTIATFNLMPGP